MSETLLIHYNIDQPQQATWSLCNDEGELTGRITTASLDELSELATTYPAVVLLNSQCLHINQLQLPTQNMQKMLKAVPYAVEEYIADDVENFHFVISKNKNSDITSVVGIDKATLQNIIQSFQQANIYIEKIIPDVLCLPADASNGQWACLNFHENSYLQTDTLSGIMLPHDIMPYVMTTMLQDKNQDPPDRIILFYEQEDPSAFSELNIEDSNAELINVVYNTHPLVVFCGHYKQASALNLLQHKFKAKRKSSGYWQHWRLAASLAVVWLTLHLGLTSFQYSKLDEANKKTKAEIERVYKQAFPQSRKIINPRVQMEQKLKALKNNSDNNSNGLLFLLSESFGTLTHDKKSITFQSLIFRNNRMEIGLDSTNLQAIENLNKNLNSNAKIKSEITSSSSEKNKVRGNLRIEGRG